MRATNFAYIKPMGTMRLPFIGEFDIDYIYHEPKRFDNFTIRLDFHAGSCVHLSGEQAFERWLEERMGTVSPLVIKQYFA